MIELNTELVKQVNAFIEKADKSFIETMRQLDRNDIMAQATIRYLLRLGHWPLTANSEYSELLTYFFGAFPDKISRDPAEYESITKNIIQIAWNYECIPIIIVPKPAVEKKPNPGKRSKKPVMVADPDYDTANSEEKAISGSRKFKSFNEDPDLKGASDRLKKAIEVQRGS